jgi:succinate dehydrogenase / fumarate reductase cytochrome b subunit
MSTHLMSGSLGKTAFYFSSSIGKKVIVAVTGIALLLFLLGHLLGNLLIYVGPDALNAYGHKLQSMGAFLWVIRFSLLAIFVIHIVATVQLTRENRAARDRYAHGATVQASKASRTMIISGLIILLFVIYHLLHFTIGSVDPELRAFKTPEGYHDVYRMVVVGFSNPLVSGFYILAIGLLCMHLSHGVASVFQTLGLRTEKSWPVIVFLGWAYAAFIFLGNISIPITVLAGMHPLD